MKKLMFLTFALILITLDANSREIAWGENEPCTSTFFEIPWEGPSGWYFNVDGCDFLIEYYTRETLDGFRNELQITNVFSLSDDPNCNPTIFSFKEAYQKAIVELYKTNPMEFDQLETVEYTSLKVDCISTWVSDEPMDPNAEKSTLKFNPGDIFNIKNLEEMVPTILPVLPVANQIIIIPIYSGWNNCSEEVCCRKLMLLDWDENNNLTSVSEYPGTPPWMRECLEIGCTSSCGWLEFSWNVNSGFLYTKQTLLDVNYNKLKVYPNPTNQKLNITLEGEVNGEVLLKIYDVTGNEQMRDIISVNMNTLSFETDFNNGTYFYEITYPTGKIYSGQFNVIK